MLEKQIASKALSLDPSGILNKITTESTLKMKIMAYSAIKIIANLIDPYSILKPETNSDSPSAKSKGVRFNSARTVKSQRINTKLLKNITAVKKVGLLIPDIFVVKEGRNRDTKMKERLISYATVCAIPRRPPIIAYFLFELHPAPNKGQTFKLSNTININKLNVFFTPPVVEEINIANIKDNNNLIIGLKKKITLFIGPSTVREFVKSFTASAAGCKIPHSPTLLGPTRSCPNPKIFRSKRVRKATLIKTGKIVSIKSSKK